MTTTSTAAAAPAAAASDERAAKKAARAEARAARIAEQDRLPAGHRPLLPRLGGVALLAGPLLIVGGAITSPPQDSNSTADYIVSLARDHGQTALSAGLFHYGWIAVAFGVLAATTLLRGRRGRLVTGVGAVAAAFGAMQFTGLLYNDWVNWALGSRLPLAQATDLSEAVTSDPWIVSWLLSAKVLGLLGLPVLMAGLARAGVVGWWTAPVMLTPFVAGALTAAVLGPVVGTVVQVLCWAPMFLVGLRLIRRPAAPSVTI